MIKGDSSGLFILWCCPISYVLTSFEVHSLLAECMRKRLNGGAMALFFFCLVVFVIQLYIILFFAVNDCCYH